MCVGGGWLRGAGEQALEESRCSWQRQLSASGGRVTSAAINTLILLSNYRAIDVGCAMPRSNRERSSTMAQLRTAVLAAAAILLACTAQAGVIDYDMSPVCAAYLPQCQAQCKAPQDFIFVCSAGSGVGGMPKVKCDCVTPAAPNGGNQSEWRSLRAGGVARHRFPFRGCNPLLSLSPLGIECMHLHHKRYFI